MKKSVVVFSFLLICFGLAIVNFGNVKSLNYKHTGEEKIMQSCKDKIGYLHIKLFMNGKPKMYKVHRLVAQAFIPNPNNYPQVNHKDENKANNCVSNLEWCTNEYNHNYGTRNKRVGKSLSKKTLCITTGEIFNSTKEASKKYGVHNGSLVECCNNKRNSAGTLPTGEKLKWMYIEED